MQQYINIDSILNINKNKRYNMIQDITSKKVLIERSKYEQVNNIILNATIQRINARIYDIKVITSKNYYKLIITPKIEEV